MRPGCVFCQIAAGTIPAHIVWSDADHLAFLDLNPIAAGHTLVIPRKHIESVFELDPSDYANLMERVRVLAGAIAAAAGAPRAGIACEGFGVAHAHVHVVPVWHGGDLDPCRQSPASEEALAEVAHRVRARITSP